MTVRVVLLHSALGLRPAVARAADRLRAAGHEVLVPDLYEGRVFDDVDQGVAHAQSLGWQELVSRARAAVPDGPVVVLGWSLGAGLATTLAATRPGVRAAVLLHAAGPWDGDWPGVPVQVHHAVDDPWVDEDPSALLAQVARSGAPASLHVYPGPGHLFDDEDLPGEHAPASASLVWSRVLAFLAEVADGAGPRR